MKEVLMKEMSFAFAVRIVNVYKLLVQERKEFVIGKQLLRSGTSIGANIREAQNAESTADFIHKLAIAQKECDETRYWLELLHATDFLSQKEYDSISLDATALLKVIRSSIITSKQNKDKQK